MRRCSMDQWPHDDLNPSDPDFRLGQEIGIYVLLLIIAVMAMIASVLRFACVCTG